MKRMKDEGGRMKPGDGRTASRFFSFSFSSSSLFHPSSFILHPFLFVLLFSGCRLSRTPEVYVPVQKTAREQFVYALEYRDSNDLLLRNKKKMDRLKHTREAVRKTFAVVVEYFPEDREVVPLAKLELAEMQAGQDRSALPVSNRDLHEAIKQLEQIRADYPEIEVVQAQSRFDAALSWQRLKDYEKAQRLFKEVSESYAESKDKTVRQIVRAANRFYQQTYVK